jgi:uncharacterized membrane protein
MALVLALAAASAFSPVARLPAQRAAVTLRPALVPRETPLFPTAVPSRSTVPVLSEAVAKETALRSAVKAIGWRFTAGIVTACTSFFFTGSLAMMYALVGWDLCSKSVTMFIGERIWNNFDWGKEKGDAAADAGKDSAKRSLAKALAWRAFAATNTFIGATLLSKGKMGAAGKIAGADSVIKTVLFYFYERVWAQVPWGKNAKVVE